MDKLLITLMYASNPDISCVKITHAGGCQKFGPLLGTPNIRGRNIIEIQKGTIVLTTTHTILRRYLLLKNFNAED